MLSTEQVREFERDGILFPVPVLTAEEVTAFRSALEEMASHLDGRLKRIDQCHLFFRWAYELATHATVLDAVEGVIGADILVHSTRVFYKHPHDPAYVSWHQDGRYSDLNAYPALTAWIALSESNPENGCLRVIPGSHKQQLYPHTLGDTADNLVNHGQVIAIEIDEAKAVDVVLHAGEMSLHHVNMIHGSKPNVSDMERVGFSVSYTSPQASGSNFPAVLARGHDSFHHFELLEQPPTADNAEVLDAHSEFLRLTRQPKVRLDN